MAATDDIRDGQGGEAAPEDNNRKGGAAVNWVLLVIAGLFEVGWAIGLKLVTAG
jgi:hypothetical protein